MTIGFARPLDPNAGSDASLGEAPLGEGAALEGQPFTSDTALPAPGEPGAACVVAEECNSGFCVDRHCCDRACDGLCEACSDAGQCNATAQDDDRCEPIECEPSATVCAETKAVQALARCAAPRQCKTACDGEPAAADIVCEEVAEGLPGLCDGAGNCIDPRSPPGTTCDSDLECGNGPCVDGVCCVEACDGECEHCNTQGACVADTVESSCGDDRQCFGRDRCLQEIGSDCSEDGDCGSGFCEAASNGVSVCCSEACSAGFVCNGDGKCVSPESDLGAQCTDNNDCLGGRCFDGRCCDVECGGACERCNAPDQEGRCVAEPAGSIDAQCGAGLECAGRGQCRQPLGGSCILNGDCRSSICAPALVGDPICCAQACPNGQRCGANGACVDAPRPDGATCSANSDCQNGFCVDGRCCESACNGQCQACSALGDCNVNPGNDASCPTVDCPQSDSVCTSYPADITTNLCGAFASCRSPAGACNPSFAPFNTPCENIAPGVRGICDGSGRCTDPRLGLGSGCSQQSPPCLSSNCTPRLGGGANVCCESACTGVCEACNSAGRCVFADQGGCPQGQQCATQTSCEAQTATVGGSCANGQLCPDGGRCINNVCIGLCRMNGNNATSGSRLDACLLAP